MNQAGEQNAESATRIPSVSTASGAGENGAESGASSLPHDLDGLVSHLGDPFGILAESSTAQLQVIARNADVAVGDLFLLPSRRGGRERVYVFRTTEYANVLNEALEMSHLARTKLTMRDAYLAHDLREEQLIELRGIVLGYAERDPKSQNSTPPSGMLDSDERSAGATPSAWSFHRPRRLPDHLSEVYHVRARDAWAGPAMEALLAEQLGGRAPGGGLIVGHLLAGEEPLPVPVRIPPMALSHHIGVFGRTGSGKSNLMMVLLSEALRHNQACFRDRSRHDRNSRQPVSLFAIDPHDEFRRWHAATGGPDGIAGIVASLTDEERAGLVAPFYYLTARDVSDDDPLARRLFLSRADVVPEDLTSIVEFTEQQAAFAGQQFARWGEQWAARVLMGDTEEPGGFDDMAAEYLPGTVAAVQRRLGFLRRGRTRVVTPHDPDLGRPYTSLLPDLLCALERGRIVVVETTLMTELEQFLATTVVARTLFALRRALRSVERADELERAIRQALGQDDAAGQVGLRTLADEIITRIENGELPYLDAQGRPVAPDQLPHVNVVVEEAPSVLNPERMRFGSVFRDISRQGRKFGIGLTVVSQQVSEIDHGVLSQLNTEILLSLGNEAERREAVRNASADMGGLEQELRVMARGQAVLSASYRDVPLPIQIPRYE